MNQTDVLFLSWFHHALTKEIQCIAQSEISPVSKNVEKRFRPVPRFFFSRDSHSSIIPMNRVRILLF